MNELWDGDKLLKYVAFISEDPDERELLSSGEYEKAKSLQRENRGVIIKEKGGESLKTRQFAEYCLKKRISVFRTENGDRYGYNNTLHKYEILSDNTLGAILLTIIEEYSSNLFGSRAQEETVRYIDLLCNSYKSLQDSSEFIVFPNGTYDVIHNIFKEDFFDKSIVNTFVMNYNYSKNAECSRFNDFLEDVFNADYELIDVVQEIIGYTFCYGQAPIDKFFYFYSVGRSGKSVLANILRKLHGAERVSALTLDSLEQRFQLASLVGKVVNITPEGSKNKLLNTSILKAITGRDAVLIEEKYKLPYTTTLHTKLIVIANHFFSVNDDSFGFWQRVLPIPFPNVYIPVPTNGVKKKGVKYQNIHLEEELSEELSGIFNWAMEGLSRLKANGWVFSYSETVEDFKNKLMLVNKPVEIFVQECIEEADEKSKIKSSMLHMVFKEWAVVNEINISEYYDSRKFHRELKSCMQSKGIAYEVRKNSVDYYCGIKFNEEIVEI